MKAIFITYNQAYGPEIAEVLESFGQKGFTRWLDIQGRGSSEGEPHYGDHAWPTLNDAIFTMVDDSLVPQILEELKNRDSQTFDLGLRAFVWNIEQTY